MTRNPRIHLINDKMSENLAPSHLAKQQFAQRLYRMMKGDRGWTQAELARRSGIPKDAISRYVTGKSFPSHENALALADALGVSETDLLANLKESAIEADVPAFEMKVSPSDPRVAWIRVNRLVTMSTAVKVATLLDADVLPD